MELRWLGKNVDLEVLSRRIQAFLEGKGFKTKLGKSAERWSVLGVIRQDDLRYSVTVNVDGSPSDFSVEVFGGEQSRVDLLLGAFGSLIGGGALSLRRLKKQEFFEKLETELSVFLEESVASLVGSSA